MSTSRLRRSPVLDFNGYNNFGLKRTNMALSHTAGVPNGPSPRGRVDKVWRTVRWAETFPEEAVATSASMESVDLTPPFAIRKIANLFDRKKFNDCAALVQRLNGISVAAILSEVPIEMLHNALPASLPILEALYVKVHKLTDREFPTGQLMTDQLVKRLVTIFSRQAVTRGPDKTGDSSNYMTPCRTIVGVILSVERNLKVIVHQRKRAIDRCLRNMARHGLVDSSGGKLMTLHDALKVEFEKIVIQYKCALQKLDELCLSAKHPVETSISSGPAPSEVSHQRLMQVRRADVQDRIIKNKTLHNVVEPTTSNKHLKKLIDILQTRIDFDKILLFHDTELRKMSEGMVNQEAYLSQILRQFSYGYGKLLELIGDITGDKINSEFDDVSSDDDDDIVPMKSTLSIMERMRIVSLNGVLPINGRMKNTAERGCGDLMQLLADRGTANNNNTSAGFHHPSSSSSTAVVPVRTSVPPAVISSQEPTQHGVSEALGNRFTRRLRTTGPPTLAKPHTNGVRHISAPIPLGMDDHSDSKPSSSTSNVSLLEQEIRYLRDELSQSREQVRKLQDQEKQLRERLADHVHKKFVTKSNTPFEDLNLGSLRPTALIRSYDDLYREGRVDTLDALDSLPELRGLDILKMKILFSVVVLSFRCVQQALHELKGKVRHLLCLPQPHETLQQPSSSVFATMEHSVSDYLCKTIDSYDLDPIVHEVCQNIYATLYDYPGLKSCAGLVDYTKNTVRLAWGLSVQNPPYYIVYDLRTFQPNTVTRFHTSDIESPEVRSFLWPMLVEAQSGQCVAKGIVIT